MEWQHIANHKCGVLPAFASYIDAAIPKPANLHIDFAVVDLLQFDGQVGSVSHDPYYVLNSRRPDASHTPPVQHGS